MIFLSGNFSEANVVGSDAQNFNPTPSGLDFVTVHSSETLEPGLYNLGLFVNYAKNPLPTHQAGNDEKAESALTGGDLNFALGLARGWDAGLSFPFILNQEVQNTGNTGHYSATGNTEIRLQSKVRFIGNDKGGVAVIGSVNFNRIKDNPYVGTDGGPIYNFELAMDGTLGDFALGLNLGHRWRNPGATVPGSGVEPLEDQWLASSAVSYHMPKLKTKLILELLAAVPAEKPPETTSDRTQSVFEGLVGMKYDKSSNLAFHLGAGAGFDKGMASPDFRVYTGISFSFGRTSPTRASLQTDPYLSAMRARPTRTRNVVKKSDSAGSNIEKPKSEEPAEIPVVVAPAESDETIREVKVFNRGSFKHIVLNNLEFQGDSLRLTPDSELYMAEGLVPAIQELNQRRPVDRIVVEGYTDSINSSEKNKVVSLGRAEVVAAVLRQRLGLNMKVLTQGLGEASPIGDNGNYQGRALNNRVEIKLIYRRTTK